MAALTPPQGDAARYQGCGRKQAADQRPVRRGAKVAG